MIYHKDIIYCDTPHPCWRLYVYTDSYSTSLGHFLRLVDLARESGATVKDHELEFVVLDKTHNKGITAVSWIEYERPDGVWNEI